MSDENNLNLTPTTNFGDEGSTKEYIVKLGFWRSRGIPFENFWDSETTKE